MRNNQEKVFQIAGCSKSVLLLLTVMGIVYGVWVWLTPPTMLDDILYRCVWEPDETAPRQALHTMNDVLRSQWIHYFTHLGRLVPHLVAQLLYCFTSDSVIKVLDTVVFVLLLYFSCHYIEGRRKTAFSLLMFWFLITIVTFGSGSALLWQMGAFNYPWTELPVVVLLCYLRHIKDREITLRHLALAPLALLAGWTHESLTLPIAISMALYVAINRKNILKSPLLPYFVFFTIGTLLNTFSPATLQRVNEYHISLSTRLFYGVSTMVFTVKVFWLLVIALFVAWRKRKDVVRAELKARFYIYFAMFLAYGIVMTSGATVTRTGYHAEFLASLLLVSLLHRFSMPKLKRSFAIVVVVVSVALMPFSLELMAKNHANAKYIEKQVMEQKASLVRVPNLDFHDDVIHRWAYRQFITEPVIFGSQKVFNPNYDQVLSLHAVLGRNDVVFFPKEFADSIDRSADAYKSLGVNKDSTQYIWQVAKDADVSRGVDLLLHHAEPSDRPLYNSFFFHEGDTFHIEPQETYEMSLRSRRFLMITPPPKHVMRRVKAVQPAR